MNYSSDIIPDWNSEGLLPAIDEDNPTSLFHRSPYIVSVQDLVARFGHTEARRRLLIGLLNYRAELHRAGLISGFQWVNGSFAEDVERTKNRAPGDIDVVTFFHVPDGYTDKQFLAEFPSLFDNYYVKDTHGIDAYHESLAPAFSKTIVERSIYWYSLWSHTRDEGLWKGYLQIDLSSEFDEVARHQLASISEGG